MLPLLRKKKWLEVLEGVAVANRGDILTQRIITLLVDWDEGEGGEGDCSACGGSDDDGGDVV